MKHFKVWKSGFLAALIAAVVCGGGCEVFREAMEAELEYGSSDRGSSDEFRPRFVLAACSIVKFPRAQWLEQEVDCNGKSIWINKNQLFDSKRVRRARAIPRPGNPDVCDLELQLDAVGKSFDLGGKLKSGLSFGNGKTRKLKAVGTSEELTKMAGTDDFEEAFVTLAAGEEAFM